ncbi:MAG: 3-deoxy-D-manno-octulosonic acid transferase [Candidatus Omnitrophota bacterium]
MYLVYDLIYALVVVFYIPYLFFKKKWHPGMKVRLAFWPLSLKEALRAKSHIWVHAVSVGEILAVKGIIQRLKAAYPEDQIVLTTVTQTGHQLAITNFPNDIVIYAPLDFSCIVNRYIRWIKPKIYITAETEIWPNLFLALHKKGVPLVLVNGRISEQSLRRYQRIKFFLRDVLRAVSVFCMQSQLDAERIISLGAPDSRVHVIGNMKLDDLPDGSKITLEELGFRPEESLWIAGSTHPGEENILLDVFASIGGEFPGLRLVLAPRHIERVEEVIQLVREKGFKPVRFSQSRSGQQSADSVMIVDTIGHLRYLYSLAKVVFVGKSLTAQGGQNIVEPAFFGKAIIVGPYVQNFKDVVESFQREGAIVQVKDSRELLITMRRLLQDSRELARIGSAAKAVVQKYQGATQRAEQFIFGYLRQRV